LGQYRFSTTKRYLPFYLLANLKLCCRLDAVDAFVLDDDAFMTRQDVESSITEAPPLSGELTKSLAHWRVIGKTKNTSIHRLQQVATAQALR